MPVCEADPWRLQYFAADSCPDAVRIPTEDADAWTWYPAHRWIYDKLALALSQGIEAAPHGVVPPRFPVFSKPIVNLRGMGAGSRTIDDAAHYDTALTAGHMWMTRLEGEHVSTDVALEAGCPRWWRHTTGLPRPGGMFDYWQVHAAPRPWLEAYVGAWARQHLRGYTGMLNVETIGGRIIDAHLRFADQWPDLYGAGWTASLVRLYAEGRWQFRDQDRRDGFSVVLFGPHGRRYGHPPDAVVAALRAQPGISSVQITFHDDREPAWHSMPPGGFRLAIINCWSLRAGQRARERLREVYFGEALAAASG